MLSTKRFQVILLSLLLCGCGYHLVGKVTHVPPGVTSIAIPTLTNQTFEPGLEIPFTQAILREFIQDRRVKVLDRKEADSILEGIVKSFNIASVAYDQSGYVLEYQAIVVMDLTLKKPTGEILWRENNLSETYWYRAANVALTNEARKNIAIQQIAGFMAERVRDRFFYNF